MHLASHPYPGTRRIMRMHVASHPYQAVRLRGQNSMLASLACSMRPPRVLHPCSSSRSSFVLLTLCDGTCAELLWACCCALRTPHCCSNAWLPAGTVQTGCRTTTPHFLHVMQRHQMRGHGPCYPAHAARRRRRRGTPDAARLLQLYSRYTAKLLSVKLAFVQYAWNRMQTLFAGLICGSSLG